MSFRHEDHHEQHHHDQHSVPWWIIGTEGGLLDHASPLRSLLLAPKERADIIVDFSKLNVGDSVI